MTEDSILDDAWLREEQEGWRKDSWRRASFPTLHLLDQEEVFTCAYDALKRRDKSAQWILTSLVQAHPGKICDGTTYMLANHAVCSDDPEIRIFAQKQILSVLKAQGIDTAGAHMALGRFRVEAKSKTSPAREAAQAMLKEIEAMYPGASAEPPSTRLQRVGRILHLSRN